MRTRFVALLVLLLLVLPAIAFANGDPASDVLIAPTVRAYFPNQRVSVQAAASLKSVLDAANKKGYTIKVALIHDESDLGTVPNLLNRPQQYSEFLGPELAFAYKGDLLVVMPTGLGLTTTDQSAPPLGAIQGMKVEAGGSPDGLALTAEEAVKKMAAAAGHPLTAASAKKKGGGGGGAAVGIIVAVVLLLVGFGAAVMLRRSQARPEPDAAPQAESHGAPEPEPDSAP